MLGAGRRSRGPMITDACEYWIEQGKLGPPPPVWRTVMGAAEQDTRVLLAHKAPPRGVEAERDGPRGGECAGSGADRRRRSVDGERDGAAGLRRNMEETVPTSRERVAVMMGTPGVLRAGPRAWLPWTRQGHPRVRLPVKVQRALVSDFRETMGRWHVRFYRSAGGNGSSSDDDSEPDDGYGGDRGKRRQRRDAGARGSI